MDQYYALIRQSPDNKQGEILERGIDFDGIHADMIALRQSAPTGITYYLEIIRPVTRPFVVTQGGDRDFNNINQ